MNIKLTISPARLLVDNLRIRRQLGLIAIDRASQAKLQRWLQPALLAVESPQAFGQAEQTLWQAMLTIMGLAVEDVALAPEPARLKIKLLLEDEPETDLLGCWHPAVLLARPELKKQAYGQLKAIARAMPGRG